MWNIGLSSRWPLIADLLFNRYLAWSCQSRASALAIDALELHNRRNIFRSHFHPLSARLAVEAREFQKAVDLFEPHKHQLDDAAAVQLAIAFEKCGRQNDAIDLLRTRGRPTTDAMGTLAGRLKRRWLRERREDDGMRAMELYGQAHGLSENSDPAQAYYHGINIAFLNLVFNRSLLDAQIWARRAYEHCSAAAKTEIVPDAWRLATQGEANLLMGDVPEALRRYREAIATQPDPWQLESMYLQALETARQLRSRQVAGNLAQTFNKRLAYDQTSLLEFTGLHPSTDRRPP